MNDQQFEALRRWIDTEIATHNSMKFEDVTTRDKAREDARRALVEADEPGIV